MSRGRPSNASRAAMSSNEQVMSSVWHGLVDTLRLLPTVPPAKPLTDEERDTQLVQSASEKATLDQALEKLSTLIALRKGENVTLAKDARESLPVPIAPVPVVSVSTPGSAGTPVSASGHNKRKRPGSTTASPAPMVNPNLSVTTGTTESTLTSVNSSTPLPPRSATPNARDTAGRQQRKDQLPLLAGRKVAFKQPKGKGDDSGADDEWILAMIKSNMDKEGTRYEVQDADDASQTWKTTLRSIIALPDPDAPSTSSSHPSNVEVFPKGSIVLGLYPETTSFYRATVREAPRSQSGGGGGGARREVYMLEFVDDNQQIHQVEKDSVVRFPS